MKKLNLSIVFILILCLALHSSTGVVYAFTNPASNPKVPPVQLEYAALTLPLAAASTYVVLMHPAPFIHAYSFIKIGLQHPSVSSFLSILFSSLIIGILHLPDDNARSGNQPNGRFIFPIEQLPYITSIEAAIYHVQYFASRQYYAAAAYIADLLRRDVASIFIPPYGSPPMSSSQKSFGHVATKWDNFYPYAWRIFSEDARPGLRDRIEGWTAYTTLEPNPPSSELSHLQNHLQRALNGTSEDTQLRTTFRVNLIGNLEWNPAHATQIEIGIVGAPTAEQLMSQLRAGLLIGLSIPPRMNWSLLINGKEPVLRETDLQPIHKKDRIELRFDNPIPSSTNFLRFRVLRTRWGDNSDHSSTTKLILRELKDNNSIISGFLPSDVYTFLKGLPEVVWQTSTQRVEVIGENLYFTDGPFAIRLLPGTASSPVLTVEIMPESHMYRRTLEERNRGFKELVQITRHSRNSNSISSDIDRIAWQFYLPEILNQLEFIAKALHKPEHPFWGIILKDRSGRYTFQTLSPEDWRSVVDRVGAVLHAFPINTKFELHLFDTDKFSAVGVVPVDLPDAEKKLALTVTDIGLRGITGFLLLCAILTSPLQTLDSGSRLASLGALPNLRPLVDSIMTHALNLYQTIPLEVSGPLGTAFASGIILAISFAAGLALSAGFLWIIFRFLFQRAILVPNIATHEPPNNSTTVSLLAGADSSFIRKIDRWLLTLAFVSGPLLHDAQWMTFGAVTASLLGIRWFWKTHHINLPVVPALRSMRSAA